MTKVLKEYVVTKDVMICSLEELIAKIKSSESKFDVCEYNALLDYNINAESTNKNIEDSTYIRKTALLTEAPITDKFVETFVNTSTTRRLFMKDLQGLVEEATVEHLQVFGYDTHLVRIAPRTYIMCNPEDLWIKTKGTKTALINLTPNRNMVVVVDRFTQKDYDEKVRDILSKIPKRD